MGVRTPSPTAFDRAYYNRFYESRRTRVRTRTEVAVMARGLAMMIEWYKGSIRGALEIGAGTGHFRDWFARHRPRVPYRSTDVSAYACRTYGHERKDITTWRGKKRYDLVICVSVLPYFDDRTCEAAIDNLGAMTETFLYLEAQTGRDLRTLYAHPLTDTTLIGRSAGWYRKRLQRHFCQLAFGLWIRRDKIRKLAELERGP